MRYTVILTIILALWGVMAFCGAANAACTNTYRTLHNGDPANADYVMDNFNFSLNCSHASGNIGVNTSPAAWASPYDAAIDLGLVGAVVTTSANSAIDLQDNVYFDGTNYILKTTGSGNIFRLASTSFQWFQTGSGTAGGTVSPSQKMTLDNSGNLTIVGCLHYNSGQTGTCLSDARVKDNVHSYSAVGLAEISALRPVTYSYNGLAGTPDDSKDHVQRKGLIAQEVQKVAPRLVSTVRRKLHPSDDAETGLLEVDYGALTFGLINAVKELKAANDSKAEKISQLEAQVMRLNQQAGQVRSLQARLDAVERRVAVRAADSAAVVQGSGR
jgi:hypothetical protein